MAAEADVLVANGSHLFLYFRRIPDVVLVGNGNEVGRGSLGGCLEIGIEAHVLCVAEHLNIWVFCLVGLCHCHGFIGRAIVLYDDLPNGVGLPDDGIYLFFQVFGTVICADDYRYGLEIVVCHR